MDIEQLKLILTIVGGAADGARDFAIAWLLVEFGKTLLGYAIGGSAIWVLYTIAKELISWGRNEQNAFGSVSECEKNKIREAIKAARKQNP